MRIIILFLLTGLWSACNLFDKKNRIALAKAGDAVLYLDELPEDISAKAIGVDSLQVLYTYITQWTNRQLLLQKALKSDVINETDIEQKVNDYQNSLLIYAYQTQWLESNLDTAVTIEEARAYYLSNQQNFELKKNIVRLHYVKLPKNAPNLEKAKGWFLSDDVDDRISLQEYCIENAENNFFNDQVWLSFQDIVKEIPIANYDEERFLSNNRFVQLSDEQFIYWILIKDFRIKSSLAPFELEIQNIRNIIINKRKVTLLNKLEQNIKKEAEKEGKIEWYIKD